MSGLGSQDITIAITVYDRQRYLRGAIRSALNQNTTERPKVIVVEDCGPNPNLRSEIVSEFGDTIEYLRNPRRRGLFDNWNACIAASSTPWLCILHDDDLLEPTFIESMMELTKAAPGRAMYYGVCDVIDDAGRCLNQLHESEPFAWHELDLEAWTQYNPVGFPGQLFSTAAAQALGGFRSASKYCADWEMWFKLALNYGAAATNRVVAKYREHYLIGRGTTGADISGRKCAYGNMQRKRHIAWLRRLKPDLRFDRKFLQAKFPLPSRFILQYGYRFSPRMLRYNTGLMQMSPAPHFGYWVFQMFSRVLPWHGLRLISWLFHWIPSRYDNPPNKSG